MHRHRLVHPGAVAAKSTGRDVGHAACRSYLTWKAAAICIVHTRQRVLPVTMTR